ncbi:hypothetical protein [Xanthomonas hortorum]|uniref:LysM peptidoglycan-binding domain-containing protein n=1 Tax=Xanthomonas hortorum TaxID=56454 RepID=A0AA47ESB1_9XANT|nr:hypothetical protein [Xanthomonas hortorum]WAH62772.1 hypothetical protein OEG85_14805 [Xanthomonas hortorum]
MSRFTLGVQATLLLPSASHALVDADAAGYGLQFGFAFGDGPAQFVVGPSPRQPPLSLGTVIEQIAKMLGIDAVAQIAHLSASLPWSKIFDVKIAPYLTVSVGEVTAVQLVVQLYDDDGYGIRLGGSYGPVTIEPKFTVYDLIVGYDTSKDGLAVSARVAFSEQDAFMQTRLLAAGIQPGTTIAAPLDDDAKTSVVNYPFPVPAQGGSNFQVKYLGLGQRFGPRAHMTKDDPIAAMFTELESTFTTNDPRQLLDSLGTYYDASRDWFVAAHILVRGWDIRAVFNDPVLYGLEITCSADQFKGLLFEILYQKLGPHLGVYYGALTMPTQFRQINLGAVALTLPSFKIWIYTNGDFKVSVGWPLGDDSIGVQVYIFTGGCGFYFGKLRSGDNPASAAAALKAIGSAAATDVVSYNPIVTFGLAMWFGVGRSISAGPFSASLSLTAQGTFQGILAWRDAADGGSVSKTPDYFWFAATVGIVGQLQGEVDLSVVKLSVLVRLSVVAGIAFETGYGTVINVTARVDAEARLKILFVTISVGFHTTISTSFEITGGTPASLDGPLDPAFHGMNDWAHRGIEQHERSLLAHRQRLRAATAPLARTAWHASPPVAPVEVALSFLLQPSVVYTADVGSAVGVATLIIGAPGASDAAPLSALETLVGALASWLLRTWSNGTGSWAQVIANLGQGRALPPAEWDKTLTGCLSTEVRFTLNPIDLSVHREDGEDGDWAMFPMFDALQMSWTGQDTPLVFADHARTYPDYRQVVEAYFAQLSLSVLTDNPDLRGAARFGAADGDAPQGPSLTAYMFDDYFLTLCRQMASSLADAERETGQPGALPDTALTRTLGGMTSRYLMNGMRLPDPATTPADIDKVDLSTLDIAAGYALNGQQFAIATNASEPPTSVSATLSLAPAPLGAVAAIPVKFAGGGSSVTSTMPVEAVPPVPCPLWSRRGLALAAAATVSVAPIPPVHGEAVWYAARDRLPWTAPDAPARFVVPLPPAVLQQSAGAPLTLTVQTGRPQTSDPACLQQVNPALMIQVPIWLVNRAAAGSVDGDGGPANPYYTDIYRIGGADDATRARIHALLSAQALAGATLSVLYDATTTGYQSDAIALSAQPIVLAKTNLSTSSEPALANVPMRQTLLRAGDDPLGPVSTLFPDPQHPDAPENQQRLEALLQLIWEVSVTQSEGYFLRYADVSGQPLPVRIFTPKGQPAPTDGIANGDTATLTLLVSFPASTTFHPWHNAFALAPQGSLDGTLYLGVADAAGTPLLHYQPSYPPGCLGFVADWSLANTMLAREAGTLYDADWIAALYHLLQFRIDRAAADSAVPFGTSLWSLALSPSSDSAGEDAANAARPDSFDAAQQSYRQVVPAYRFVTQNGLVSSTPLPYAAIGGKPNLMLRVNDVFGNALDGATDTFTTDFPVLYNDALLAPMEWPGVRCAYRFEPGQLDKPSQLGLSMQFDPSLVIRTDPALAHVRVHGLAAGATATDDDRAQQQIRAALGRYATVAAQLADPHTCVTLTQSVLPSNGGELGDGSAIKQALTTFANDIVQQLSNALGGGTATPKSLLLQLPFDKTDLANRGDDLFAVTVTLTFARPPELVDEVARTGMPRAVSVAMPLAADLDPPSQGTARARQRAAASGAAPVEDVGLAWFASQFEASFAGFDGADGTTRLAVRTTADSPATGDGGASLWGMRWSKTHGIHVQFRQCAASYFTLLPLNTKLMSGPAQVPVYNPDTLVPTYTTQTFSSVDVDAWAQSFLSAFDELLAPANCAALAALDGAAYQTLMGHKATLAKALARGVGPVFPALSGGDLAAAQDQFEQSVLAALSTAYAVSSIVQMPADVFVANTAEAGTLPPRFFGGLTASATASGPTETLPSSCSISSAKLPIATATASTPGLLNFLVTAAHAGNDANLHLDLTYGARFVEHQIDDTQAAFGYTPSQWLRFVLELPNDPLSMPLGAIDAPVPVRAFPASPVLQTQRAEQTTPVRFTASATTALQWDYSTRLVLAEQEAQDELWLTLTYNRPVSGTLRGRQLSELGTIEAVFEALAAFMAAWPVLRPAVLALQQSAFDAHVGMPTPQQVIGALLDQIGHVTAAWAAWRGPPGDAARVLLANAPVVQSSTGYVLNLSHAFDEQKTVQLLAQGAYANGQCDASSIVWPAINGQMHGEVSPAGAAAPDDTACWFMATYAYAALPEAATGTLDFVWANLDIATRQTGYSTWWIVRNANLASANGVRTNPALIYRTPEVSFASPVVPIITVPRCTFGSGDALADAIENALAPLAEATSAAAKERLLKIAATYSYQIAAPAQGGTGLWSDMPILLATDVRLTSDDVQAVSDNAVTLPVLAGQLANDCARWFAIMQPSTDVALLRLDVTLFANVEGTQVPIVLAPELEIQVPPGGWKPSP